MLFSPAALRCFVAPQQAPSLFWREMQSTDWRSKRVESKMWNTSPVRTEQMSFNFLCRGSSLATNIQLCLWLGTYWEAFDHFGHLLAHQLLDLFSTQWWGGGCQCHPELLQRKSKRWTEMFPHLLTVIGFLCSKLKPLPSFSFLIFPIAITLCSGAPFFWWSVK